MHPLILYRLIDYASLSSAASIEGCAWVQLEVGLKALKARNSTAQGASPGNRNAKEIEPCKGGIDAC
jgi:hypothetical protein